MEISQVPEKTDPAAAEVKPHISPSQMDTYDKCAYKYMLWYCEKIPCPASVPLVIGSATHSSAEKDLTAMMEWGSLLPDEEVCSNARDAFVEKWNTSGDILFDEKQKDAGAPATMGSALDMSVTLATLHHREIAPDLFPTHVEHKFRLNVANSPRDIVGVLDVRESVPSRRLQFPEGTDAGPGNPFINVRDTKTAGRTPTQQTADRSPQLTTYAMWERQKHGRAPDGVYIDALIKNKVPVAKSFRSVRDDNDFRAFLLRMERFCDAIEKGAFVPCDPTHWICTEKWCGYYDTCPFGRRKRVQI